MITIPHTQSGFTLHRSEMAQTWQEAERIATEAGCGIAVVSAIRADGQNAYASQDIRAWRVYETSGEWFEHTHKEKKNHADD